MKTKVISKFGIIFAVTATMVTIAAFTACNSDDDFEEDIAGEYTLATRVMTRAGENSNGDRHPGDGIYIAAGDTTIYEISIEGFEGEVHFTWSEGFTGERTPQSTVNATISLREYQRTDYQTGAITNISLLYKETLWNDSGNGIIVKQDYKVTSPDMLGNTHVHSGCYTKSVSPAFTPLPYPDN